ncbi:MAG: S8 family serine peptidase [Pseudolabrys sp.]
MRMTLGLVFAAAIAAFSLPAIDAGHAQYKEYRSYQVKPTQRYVAPKVNRAVAPKQNYATPGHSGGGYKGPGRGGGDGYRPPGRGGRGIPGWVGPAAIGVIGGIIATTPPADAMPPGPFIEDPNFVDENDIVRPPPRNTRRAPPPPRQPQTARRGSGVPPAGETRMVPDEVVIELPNTTSAQAVDALQRRFRLERLESQTMTLAGTTFYRWRIPDRRSVPAVVRALETSNAVASAQPNYLFTLQQSGPEKVEPTEVKADPNAVVTRPKATGDMRVGDPAQYALTKLRLGEAHALANGENVLVAVIDSGVDLTHPELAGAVVGTFDTLKSPPKGHEHGTAIASLITGQGRLKGTAPGARILAVRAFDPNGSSAEATTFNIMKGLDWSVANGARIINMSFAGPADPAIQRSLEAARKKGVVSIAAAGNEGPKAKPLYPAAYAGVIAVAATDAEDKIYKGSNQGRHITVAAPGVDILVAIPEGGYKMLTGTSMSAAEVSGIVALMLQRNPNLTPDAVRSMLAATARDLGPKGRDDAFGAGLTDAYRALTDDAPRVSNAAR